MVLHLQDSALILPNYQSHSKGTQGTNLNFILLKIRNNACRKTFAFQISLIYNQLPNEQRQEQCLSCFMTKCNDFNIVRI